MNKFEFIEHTADVGVKVYGKTLPELFENAAYAMYNIICEKFHNVSSIYTYKNQLEDYELESLLVSYLNDLIYQTFVNKVIFSKFKVEIEKQEKFFIQYQCIGEKYKKETHGTLHEIKSATFHNLSIRKTKKFYKATIIFDI